MKRIIPFVIAIATGLLTLIGLLANSAAVQFVLNSAAFLAALALLAGVLNLFRVHLQRLVAQRSIYSLFLLLSMGLVLVLGFAGGQGAVTLADAFNWVQRPLEAALASLLAFFLVGAIIRLAQRRQDSWSRLFVASVIVVLLITVVASARFVPLSIAGAALRAQAFIDGLVVSAGMRGLLIGVALGTIMLSLRLLVGLERPYNQ